MRARVAVLGVVAFGLMLSQEGTGLGLERRALPNLVPRPPGLMLGEADPGTGLKAIRLQTPMTNVGNAHLELLGMPDGADMQTSTAHQCVDWAQDRVCSEYEEVGQFVWHPDHGHHHFENFAQYELRRIKGGRPDMSPAGLIAGGDKVSFCLMDTNDANSDEPSGLGGWPVYTSCLAGTGFQGISRGWADTYVFNREDQQIVVDGVPPGTYAVVVTVDPKNLVFETVETDNTVITKIKLTGDSLLKLCVFDQSLRRCRPSA